MFKQCKKCEEWKSIDDFSFRKDTNKFRNVCNTCRLTQIQQWQKDNRIKVNINQRKYNETFEGRCILLYNSARTRAKNKNQDFKLTLQNVKDGLKNGFCEKTGIPFDFSTQNRIKTNIHINPYSPSIDKKNPFGIYEPENVQYVCSWYNFAKGQFNDEFFMLMCNMVKLRNDKS